MLPMNHRKQQEALKAIQARQEAVVMLRVCSLKLRFITRTIVSAFVERTDRRWGLPRGASALPPPPQYCTEWRRKDLSQRRCQDGQRRRDCGDSLYAAWTHRESLLCVSEIQNNGFNGNMFAIDDLKLYFSNRLITHICANPTCIIHLWHIRVQVVSQLEIDGPHVW